MTDGPKRSRVGYFPNRTYGLSLDPAPCLRFGRWTFWLWRRTP